MLFLIYLSDTEWYKGKGLLQKLNRVLNSLFEYLHILFFITLKCVCNQ